MSKYKIEAVEIGESPELASICAISGSTVYEDPRNSAVPREHAKREAERISSEGIDAFDIERDWKLI